MKTIRIGLMWHSARSTNLGVGALTIANMAFARAAAAELGLAPHFTIIGMRDGGPSCVEPDEADVFGVDYRSLLSPGGCWSVIGSQDCVLDIGGGDSFADIHPPPRFLFLWLTKMIAASRGVPLLLSPQTIGPFSKTPQKQLARMALERAAGVVARDRLSMDAMAQIAPRARTILSADVALALPYEDNSARRGGSLVRVGVNVSGILWAEAESGSNRYGLSVHYAELMRNFIASLAKTDGVELHLVTHVASGQPGWDNDAHVADQLAASFPNAIRVPDFADPRQAKSYISGLDFLVAGRMHACIAAFSSGVPVVPVAYTRKFAGLFDLIGYPWRIPVTGLSTGEALAYLDDCLARRAVLAGDVAAGMTRVEPLLDVYRSELHSFFASAVRRKSSS